MVTDQTNARAVRWCTPAGGCRVLRVLWSNAVRWLRFTTRPEACPLLRGPLHELTLQPDASCPLKTMRPRPLASIPCSVCDNASQHTTSRLPPPRRLTFSSLTTTRFLLLFSSPTCMESSRAETQQAFSRRTRRRKPRRFRTNQPPHSRSQYPVLSFFFFVQYSNRQTYIPFIQLLPLAQSTINKPLTHSSKAINPASRQISKQQKGKACAVFRTLAFSFSQIQTNDFAFFSLLLFGAFSLSTFPVSLLERMCVLFVGYLSSDVMTSQSVAPFFFLLACMGWVRFFVGRGERRRRWHGGEVGCGVHGRNSRARVEQSTAWHAVERWWVGVVEER